jgi:hypothetical protein
MTKKTTYDVIQADGSVTSHVADLDDEPGYKAISKLVVPYLDGQNLEHVTVLWNGKYTDMFVGEFSAVVGWPVNERATEIYLNNIAVHDPDLYAQGGHPKIYGPVVVFSRRIWY